MVSITYLWLVLLPDAGHLALRRLVDDRHLNLDELNLRRARLVDRLKSADGLPGRIRAVAAEDAETCKEKSGSEEEDSRSVRRVLSISHQSRALVGMHLPVTTTVLFFFDVSVFSLLCSSMLVWSEFIRERTWSLLAVSQLAGWLKCLLSFPFLLLLLLVHLFCCPGNLYYDWQDSSGIS